MTTTNLPTPPPHTPSIMDFFPLASPRKSQEIVIKEIDSAFKSGKRYVILEAPVGSGKSAIAMTFARAEGTNGAHLLTPRKGLQDQYYQDFEDHIVLMKGRNAYPCTVEATPAKHKAVIKEVKTGKVKPPSFGESCATGPCKENKNIANICKNSGGCPYAVAIELAQQSDIIVHNLHSFLFQTYFGDKFEPRRLLVIDEAHEIEGMLREFSSSTFTFNRVLTEEFIAGLNSAEVPARAWSTFFLEPDNIPSVTQKEREELEKNKDYRTDQQRYLEKVQALTDEVSVFAKGSSIEVAYLPARPGTNAPAGTKVTFVPHSVSARVKSTLLDYGQKCLLMSGTIYSKSAFCAEMGIKEDEAYFIRVPSAFPVSTRPIYLKPAYQTNTSHAKWNESFPEMIAVIKKIMAIFKDDKGLIHAPSYASVGEITDALKDVRIIPHEASTAQETLEKFFESKGNSVLVSPICQQGVDFKDDRARFQIILRVPYLNTSSAFVEDMLAKNFAWYNRQALIVFGQQIGRINRHGADYGATFLVDSRFNGFISKNRGLLPQWVQDAIIYK